MRVDHNIAALPGRLNCLRVTHVIVFLFLKDFTCISLTSYKTFSVLNQDFVDGQVSLVDDFFYQSLVEAFACLKVIFSFDKLCLLLAINFRLLITFRLTTVLLQY
jgi:hypothetical protein